MGVILNVNESLVSNNSHNVSNGSQGVYNVTELPGAPNITIDIVGIIVATVLALFIVSVIIGNIFVILSVALFRDMRTLTNGLIVSLATADLLVALIVLPVSLHLEIVGGVWVLGPHVCDFWITADVFCCTSSILNIVVIAVDRYWLITRNVKYTHNEGFPRSKVCLIMVFLAWSLSGIISASPLFGWRKGDEKVDPYVCLISQDIGYTIFSTFGAFYFPLFVILIVYMKIFKVARSRVLAKHRAKARMVHPSMASTAFTEVNGNATTYQRTSSNSNSPQPSPRHEKDNRLAPPPPDIRPRHNNHNNNHKRNRMSKRRRGRLRSSARTLGLIIGAFVLCWLPFFLVATIRPFCPSCDVPPIVGSIILWLGYSNSLLNPAIYAIWDKNFRRSFKKLATCDVRWGNVF